MNTSSFFHAGILWMSLLAAGALPQTTGNQADLVKQSSIIFAGTVRQVGATSFAGVPKSAQTIVVRVDSVLKKPAAVSLKNGDDVTVEVKDPAAFQDGTQATLLCATSSTGTRHSARIPSRRCPNLSARAKRQWALISA